MVADVRSNFSNRRGARLKNVESTVPRKVMANLVAVGRTAERKALTQRNHQATHFSRVEKCWRATTEVQLHDLTVAVVKRALTFNFFE